MEADGSVIDGVEKWANRWVHARILQKHFNVAFDHSQRRAKFMRGDTDEIGFGLVEAFEQRGWCFQAGGGRGGVHY